MRLDNRPTGGGKHRKVTPSRTKGRVALVAAVASTVSSAGIGAATAATLANQPDSEAPETAGVDLVNNEEALPVDQAGEVEDAAPQILTINEYKPAHDLAGQLDKAVDFSNQRAAEAQAEADRIAAENAAAEAAAAEDAGLGAQGLTTDYITGAAVVKPAQGVFTSGFGPRWGTIHTGIDIANSVGTPILAAMAGTVIDSGPAQGYGQWIRIRHDDGSMTVYGHMETLNVGVGERVAAGQQIAGMGNRGFSTGSHLHFEYHPSGNGAVDPVPWFAAHGISI